MVLTGVIVLGVLGLLAWPRASDAPLLQLKLVRQTVEQGKPVAYFKVLVGDRRRIQITGAEKIIGDTVDECWAEQQRLFGPNAGFWAPSQVCPTGDPAKGKTEFGVVVPTNAAVWNLRVSVIMETPNQVERIRRMPEAWRSITTSFHVSKPRAAWVVWNAFYNIGAGQGLSRVTRSRTQCHKRRRTNERPCCQNCALSSPRFLIGI